MFLLNFSKWQTRLKLSSREPQKNTNLTIPSLSTGNWYRLSDITAWSGRLWQLAWARLSGESAGQLPKPPNCKGRQGVTGITGNMAILNSGFHAWKFFFFGNYPKFGHVPSNIFSSPLLGRKGTKNVGLKGRKIISLPGAHKDLGPTLEIACIYICVPKTQSASRRRHRYCDRIKGKSFDMMGERDMAYSV